MALTGNPRSALRMVTTSETAAKSAPRQDLAEAAIILFVCALAAAIYGFTQDRMAYGGGYPYDASAYMEMAKEVSLGHDIAAEKPFVYRLALPYLVGTWFPDRLLDGFLIINLTCAAVMLCILYAFLRHFTTNRSVILTLLLIFVANPQAPFRFTYFYPALTDTPALLVMLSMLYLNVRWPTPSIAKTAAMSVLSLAGVLFREIVVLIPFSLACAASVSCIAAYANKEDKKKKSGYSLLLSIGPIAAGLLGLYLTHAWVQSSGEYTFVDHALLTLNRNIRSPSIYVLSVLTGYGPVVLLLIVQWKAIWRQLRHRVELAVFLGSMLLIAGLGGYHTDRFMYWAFPAVLPLQAIAVERLLRLPISIYSIGLMASVAVAQLLAFRALGGLPNATFDALSVPGHPRWIFFAPYGDAANFGQIYAAYMGLRSRAILSAEYLLLAGWLFFLWRHSGGPTLGFGRGDRFGGERRAGRLRHRDQVNDIGVRDGSGREALRGCERSTTPM